MRYSCALQRSVGPLTRLFRPNELLYTPIYRGVRHATFSHMSTSQNMVYVLSRHKLCTSAYKRVTQTRI